MTDAKASKPWGRFIFGLVISALLVYWLFTKVSWEAVWENIQSFPLWAIGLSILIVLLSIPLRTMQWYWLLGATDTLSRREVLRAICLGHLANVVLPMRGGEIVKAGVLTKRCKLPLERVLTSIVLCRVQDLVPIGFIFLFFLSQVDQAALETLVGKEKAQALSDGILPHMNTILVIGGVLAILCTGAFFALKSRGGVVAGDSFIARLMQWFEARLRQVIDSIKLAGNPRRFLSAFIAGLMCWCLFTLASLPLLMTMDLSISQGLYAALIITAATTFFQLVPSAPTALGTFHFGCTLALSWVLPELSPERALAFAMVLHAIGAFTPALPGLLFIYSPQSTAEMVHEENAE